MCKHRGPSLKGIKMTGPIQFRAKVPKREVDDITPLQIWDAQGCDQLWPLLSTANPQYLLPSAKVCTIGVEETNQWDRYCSLYSSGIEEYTQLKTAEKAAINDKVVKFFNDTLERREDGYYVRLPFKDNCETLPNNKTPAYSRLIGVLNSFDKNQRYLKNSLKRVSLKNYHKKSQQLITLSTIYPTNQ
ncbi:hypothetical protein OESDEN_06298 [Oesophagostomum dentatum]|uniref:Uncharacterized protein n=1 Tax=Oesophagostomum dentatum TaxID=61180 RepID=A0A0B1TCF1_OESDE|nr:hypothetical protein OESDEN_06298 [Oesophagostomum dentatum]